MELNRNLTNDVLLADANIKQQLDNGNLVLIDMVPTSNPEYTNLYFIGKVTGLASSNTGVSSLQAALLGWNNSEVYMRSIQNASTAVAQQLQKGQAIPGTIRVIDSLEPSFDGQTSRIDRNGSQLLNNGKPIYRSTQICTVEELDSMGHATIEVTERVGAQQPQARPQQPVNQQQPVGANVGQPQAQQFQQPASNPVGNQGQQTGSEVNTSPSSSVNNLLGNQA